jgi:hypothetical protein
MFKILRYSENNYSEERHFETAGEWSDSCEKKISAGLRYDMEWRWVVQQLGSESEECVVEINRLGVGGTGDGEGYDFSMCPGRSESVAWALSEGRTGDEKGGGEEHLKGGITKAMDTVVLTEGWR